MTLPMWSRPMHSWRLLQFIPEGEHSSVSKSVDLAKRERIVNDSFGIRSWQSISCQRPMLLPPSLAHGQLGFGRIIQVLDKAWNESGIRKFYSLRFAEDFKGHNNWAFAKSLAFERCLGEAGNNMSEACQCALLSGLQSSSKAGGLSTKGRLIDFRKPGEESKAFCNPALRLQRLTSVPLENYISWNR